MTLRPRLFFITGISGSGKTTIARRLNQLGHVALDSKIQKGLFFFSDKGGNKPIDYQPNNQKWSSQYKWVLNKPMFNELMEKYKTANRIFLCGGSDDLAQYWPLGEKVFLLKVDAATMINRLSSPTRDNIHGKDKQTQDILIQRIQRYQTKKIAAGAIPIDATRPVGDVVADIIDKSR